MSSDIISRVSFVRRIPQSRKHVLTASRRFLWIPIVAFAALILACQSAAPTATPAIDRSEVQVIETAVPATLAPTPERTPTPMARATATAVPASPTPTATPAPTKVPDTPTPSEPSLIATVTPNPTFEALRASPTPTPNRSTPTPDPDPDRPRHVFRVPISNIVVPDPVFGDHGDSSILLYEIYAGLTTFTGDEDTPVQLDMASAYRVGEGGLVHTFILKPELAFSDGSPVTAADFKWSWERALRVAARVSVSTQAERVLAPIEGAVEMLAGDSEELVGVVAVDARTLVITLTTPRSDLQALLAHPAAAVLQRENVEDWSVDWSLRVSGDLGTRFNGSPALRAGELPIGSGPFKLTRFDEDGEAYIIERNEHYHGGDVQLDSVHLDALAVSEAFDHPDGLFVGIEELFLNGAIDAGNLPVSVDISGQSGPDYEGYATVRISPTVFMLVFNPSIPPFDSLDFRRALVSSLDTDGMVGYFGGTRADGIVSQDTPGFQRTAVPIQYDLDEAMRSFDHFEDATPGVVGPIDWVFRSSGTFEKERQMIASNWSRELSLNFKLRQGHISEFQQLRRSNQLPVILIRWMATYPHMQSAFPDFRQLFGDIAWVDGFEETASLMAAAVEETDPVVSLRLYAELEQHLMDAALVIPLGVSAGTSYFVPVQPWVHGYAVGRYGGSRFKDVWFDDSFPGAR